jgi:dienelactone hydrolase
MSREDCGDPSITLSRRALLRSGALAGKGALLQIGLGEGSWGAYGGPVPSIGAFPSSATEFFPDPTMNGQALLALGGGVYGTSEVGEVLRAIDNARRNPPPAGCPYQSYYQAFYAMGRHVAGVADRALAAGHRATARRANLRASQYFSQALYFVLGSSTPTRARERAVYQTMEARWDQACQLFDPPFERVAIPYRGTTMPGYLLKPDRSSSRRPTVILNNGTDAQNIDLFAFGGSAALERGWNALIFEGPGQGSMLFTRDLPLIPDWENVVTPVVDVLMARPDVDPSRIAIVGRGLCGASVARAAAFEHRLAAVCLDPGVINLIDSWQLGSLLTLAREGKQQEVDRIWAERLALAPPQVKFRIAKNSETYGRRGFYRQIKYMEQFDCGSLIGRISSPTLVMEAEGEHFYPGQSRQVYNLLKAPRQLAVFTAAEGAQYHGEPMAPQTRNAVLFDWLEQSLRA